MNCDVSLEVFIAVTVTNRCSLTVLVQQKLCVQLEMNVVKICEFLDGEMRRPASSLKNVNFSVNVPRDVGRVRNHKPEKNLLV